MNYLSIFVVVISEVNNSEVWMFDFIPQEEEEKEEEVRYPWIITNEIKKKESTIYKVDRDADWSAFSKKKEEEEGKLSLIFVLLIRSFNDLDKGNRRLIIWQMVSSFRTMNNETKMKSQVSSVVLVLAWYHQKPFDYPVVLSPTIEEQNWSLRKTFSSNSDRFFINLRFDIFRKRKKGIIDILHKNSSDISSISLRDSYDISFRTCFHKFDSIFHSKLKRFSRKMPNFSPTRSLTCSPLSRLTCRFSCISHLFPISIRSTSAEACWKIIISN